MANICCECGNAYWRVNTSCSVIPDPYHIILVCPNNCNKTLCNECRSVLRSRFDGDTPECLNINCENCKFRYEPASGFPCCTYCWETLENNFSTVCGNCISSWGLHPSQA